MGPGYPVNIIDTGAQVMNMDDGLEIKLFERIKQIPQTQ